VAPGADPGAIALTFEGAEAVDVDGAGDLVLRLAGGELRQRKPVVYQELDGSQQTIPAGYVLRPDAAVGFEVGAYDASRPLLIDPVLTYSTYLGGSNSDVGTGIAVDSGGNAYVTGLTRSGDFPITPGAFDTTCGVDGQCNGGVSSDGFVTKLNPQGSALVYSTYLGGTLADQGNGIVVDPGGNAYVTGSTSSPNFPTTLGAYQTSYLGGNSNAFVTKLNASGSGLVYSTFLVGSVSSASGLSIAIDSGLNAYTTGFIDSAVVFTKLNSAGSALVYGGTITGNGQQAGNGIVGDARRKPSLADTTCSSFFPFVSPFQMRSGGGEDAFATNINPAGNALLYSTYLGGSGQDQGTDIAIDAAGNAYVTGQTCSTNFPVQNPIQASNVGTCNAFVTKLNAGGSALIYSTYLGGSGTDRGLYTAVDAANNAYVTGQTCSTNFPVQNPIQTSNLGLCDAFVTKINAAGSALVYSTYLGGNGADTGFAIAVDNAGGAYLTGSTTSPNFPTTAGAFDTTCGTTGACLGLSDAFVAKISDVADLAITKTGTPNPVNVNSTLTYTLIVTNNGPSIATGTVVSDTLPGGLTFVSATATQGTCTGTSALSCNLGSLAVGGTATVRLSVLPPAAGSPTNPPTVASDQSDSTPANTASTAVPTVSAATSTPTPTAPATTTPVPTSTATATPTIVPPICNPRPQVGV